MVSRHLNPIVDFDHASMLWIREKRTQPFVFFFKVLTWSGTGKAWVVMAIALNILQARGIEILPAQRDILRAMLCPLIAWAAGSVLKRWAARRRPTQLIEGYRAEASVPSCGSFPSSHASSTIAFAVALAILQHGWAEAVTAWALLVTFSRYYLGVHFPSDLLGGLVLGLLCAFAILPLAALFQLLGA